MVNQSILLAVLVSTMIAPAFSAKAEVDFCEGLKECTWTPYELRVDATDAMWLGARSLGKTIRQRATEFCKTFPNANVAVKFGNGTAIHSCTQDDNE